MESLSSTPLLPSTESHIPFQIANMPEAFRGQPKKPDVGAAAKERNGKISHSCPIRQIANRQPRIYPQLHRQQTLLRPRHRRLRQRLPRASTSPKGPRRHPRKLTMVRSRQEERTCCNQIPQRRMRKLRRYDS